MRKTTDTSVVETDEDVDRMIARAKEVQQQRLKAPEVTSRSVTGCSRWEKVSRFCPEAMPLRDAQGYLVNRKGDRIKKGQPRPSPEFYAFFADKDKIRMHVENGAEPVRDSQTGGMVTDGGDVLMRIPSRLKRQAQSRAGIESRERLRDLTPAAKDKQLNEEASDVAAITQNVGAVPETAT